MGFGQRAAQVPANASRACWVNWSCGERYGGSVSRNWEMATKLGKNHCTWQVTLLKHARNNHLGGVAIIVLFLWVNVHQQHGRSMYKIV